ncbi:unnamed protein product [Fraxinus pennsylvanica]|uniref:Uncharacterized protein n=1 Tax=Fraxinus pennsylvanica TaxID=56036 RepID=A0AAD2E4G6_9LAMI|nr:unnamed protein product [Fraxinus pennsylvanica]
MDNGVYGSLLKPWPHLGDDRAAPVNLGHLHLILVAPPPPVEWVSSSFFSTGASGSGGGSGVGLFLLFQHGEWWIWDVVLGGVEAEGFLAWRVKAIADTEAEAVVVVVPAQRRHGEENHRLHPGAWRGIPSGLEESTPRSSPFRKRNQSPNTSMT